MAALADDDDLAARMNGRSPVAQVPLTEYSPEAERLTALIDRIGELLSLEIAKASGRKKPHPVKPYPRPVTAAQRAAQRRRYQKFDDLRKRLLPDRG